MLITSFTPYQFSVVRATIASKNSLFLRQLRGSKYLRYAFIRSEETFDIYKNQLDKEFYGVMIVPDSYQHFQPEYFQQQLRGLELRNKILIGSLLDVFYLQSQTIYVYNLRIGEPLTDFLVRLHKTDLRQFVGGFLYICHQLVRILSLLHQVNLTLCGDFSCIFMKEQILTIELSKVAVRVPASFEDGVSADLLKLKEILIHFGKQAQCVQNKPVIMQLNQIFRIINDFGQEATEHSLLFGLKPGEVTALMLEQPFFNQRRLVFFPQRLKEQTLITVVYMKQNKKHDESIPIIIDEDNPRPNTKGFRHRSKSAVRYQAATIAKREEVPADFPVQQNNRRGWAGRKHITSAAQIDKDVLGQEVTEVTEVLTEINEALKQESPKPMRIPQPLRSSRSVQPFEYIKEYKGEGIAIFNFEGDMLHLAPAQRDHTRFRGSVPRVAKAKQDKVDDRTPIEEFKMKTKQIINVKVK